MLLSRTLCTVLVACVSVRVAAAQIAFVFEDDFERGEACAWSPTAAFDPCASSRLYAHSGQNLYRIDTATLEAILIGPFDTGGPSITDIAVSRDDVMLGVSLAKIWVIDAARGTAHELASFNVGGESLSSLSFVPLDDADPQSAELLVAAGDSGEVYQVDPHSGDTTSIGNYGTSSGMQIRSSGDIVSVHGFGTFATVTIGDTPTDLDDLASIDTTTWAATPIGKVSTGYDRVVGLGFWAGTLFGFVDNGSGAGTGTTITIDPVTGVGTFEAVSAFRWSGAGVATDAPILE